MESAPARIRALVRARPPRHRRDLTRTRSNQPREAPASWRRPVDLCIECCRCEQLAVAADRFDVVYSWGAYIKPRYRSGVSRSPSRPEARRPAESDDLPRALLDGMDVVPGAWSGPWQALDDRPRPIRAWRAPDEGVHAGRGARSCRSRLRGIELATKAGSGGYAEHSAQRPLSKNAVSIALGGNPRGS